MLKLNLSLPVSIELDRAILAFMGLIYLSFSFAAMFMGSSMFRLLGGLTGAFFIVYFFLVYRVRVWTPLLISLLVLAVVIASADANLLAALFFLLALCSCLCLAILVRDYDLGLVLIKIPLLLFSLLLLYLHLMLGFGPNDFNHVFQGYSRNGVGAVLLAFSVGYVWYCYEKKTRPSLILGTIVLFLMFPLYGRANILGGAIIFVLILYLNVGLAGLFFWVLIFIGALAAGFGNISEYLLAKTNFGAGVESVRYEMLQDYVMETDIGSLFLGTDLSKVESIVDYGGNPHNAFLRAHSYFGFMVIFLISGLAIGFLLLFSNGLAVLSILALVFIGRASLDIIYFGNVFDFLMLGPFLYFYRPVRSTLCL